MLRPAHVGHFPLLRTLIRNGATRGSFDAELAADSPEATLLFANLRQALATGSFTLQDPRSGRIASIVAPAYVYFPDIQGANEHPIGFGLFREIADGYELWMTGIDEAWSGRGQDRNLMSSLLATPAGQLTSLVRVNRAGDKNAGVASVLAEQGFLRERETPRTTWFARDGAPSALVARRKTAPTTRKSIH